MPRHDPKPAGPSAAKDRRRQPGGSAAEAEAGGPDLLAGIPGITGDAVSPELREAVARLAAECRRLRDALTEARGRIASLERLADEDALTPVANRRAFVRELMRMIAFTNRYGVPASIVYFDVNNMKQINDAHGHPAGDAALRHVATVLQEHVRSSDVVGRLGGDEFGVVLAQTDDEQAHGKAAALAEAIAASPLRWNGFAIPVSAAYGVYPLSGREDPQQAIEAADRAMYRQKRAASPTGA